VVCYYKYEKLWRWFWNWVVGRGWTSLEVLAGESQGCLKETMVGKGELEVILLWPQTEMWNVTGN